MKLLLDTHIFLWYITNDKRLKNDWVAAIRSSENDVFLSVVSNWEIAIKYQLGKLPLPGDPATYIPHQREKHQLHSLSLGEDSISQLHLLPPIHRDPFDRMLMCQALAAKLILVTADANIRKYPVNVLS